MANLLRPGFRWHSGASGAAMPNPKSLAVADDYDGDLGGANKDIAVGDPIKLLSTGLAAIAAAGETVWGVCVGIEPHYDASLGAMKFSNTLPNQTSYDTNYERESRILVVRVGAGQEWLVCTDEVSATYDTYAEMRAFVGEHCDHVFVASQMPVGHCLLDISTHTPVSGQWQIIGVPSPTLQDFSSAYVELLVTINEGQTAPFSATGI